MRVQGPVLAGGFLDVLFSGLRDVVVIGLITCERVVLGKSAKVLAGVHRVFVHHIVEEEAESQEDEQDDRREDRQQEEERESRGDTT